MKRTLSLYDNMVIGSHIKAGDILSHDLKEAGGGLWRYTQVFGPGIRNSKWKVLEGIYHPWGKTKRTTRPVERLRIDQQERRTEPWVRGGSWCISYLWKGLGVHFGYDDWALYALEQRSEMIWYIFLEDCSGCNLKSWQWGREISEEATEIV